MCSALNEYWGLKHPKVFSQEFDEKWGKIDIENMSYDEIKLFARFACYLEAKEQMV